MSIENETNEIVVDGVDVEGHGFRGPEGTLDDAGGDVEGHGFKGPEGTLDDAEGHWLPASAYEREGGRSRRSPGNGGDDDVEGHVNFRPLDRSQGA